MLSLFLYFTFRLLLSFALVWLWSTLNNLGIVNSDLPITAMDTLTMDLDPGTLTTILATLTTDLFTPTTILATTTKHQQSKWYILVYHSEPKLRIPFGNYWEKSRFFLYMAWISIALSRHQIVNFYMNSQETVYDYTTTQRFIKIICATFWKCFDAWITSF